MPTIKDLGDQWPFPAVNEAYKRGDDTWFRTTERIAWDLIESVPTVRCAGYEFMGEPFTHVDGYPVHCAIVRIGARHYLRNVEHHARWSRFGFQQAANDRGTDVIWNIRHYKIAFARNQILKRKF